MYLSTVSFIRNGLMGVMIARKIASHRDKKNFLLYGAAKRNTLRKFLKSNNFFNALSGTCYEFEKIKNKCRDKIRNLVSANQIAIILHHLPLLFYKL
jgi:hypothetical protein